jgi:hypothetical protein
MNWRHWPTSSSYVVRSTNVLEKVFYARKNPMKFLLENCYENNSSSRLWTNHSQQFKKKNILLVTDCQFGNFCPSVIVAKA